MLSIQHFLQMTAPGFCRNRSVTVRGLAVNGSPVLNSLQAILESTLRGDGIAHLLVPFVKPYLDDGSLVTVLDEYQHSYPPLFVYYPQEHRSLKLMRSFLDVFAL